jgi:hypothetical protein
LVEDIIIYQKSIKNEKKTINNKVICYAADSKNINEYIIQVSPSYFSSKKNRNYPNNSNRNKFSKEDNEK